MFNSLFSLILIFVCIIVFIKLSELIITYKSYRNSKIEVELDLEIERAKLALDTVKIVIKEELLTLRGNDAQGKNVFEVFCSNLLSFMGYEDVEVTTLVGDGGKDVIARKDGEKYYIECKLWDWNIAENSVGRPVIQKLVGAMFCDRVKNGMVITSSYFTNEALEYVKQLPKDIKVELIDGDTLVAIIKDVRHQILPSLQKEYGGEILTDKSIEEPSPV